MNILKKLSVPLHSRVYNLANILFFVAVRCGVTQCKLGGDCCKECDDLIQGNPCESKLNGSFGCHLPLCVDKGTCL